MGLWDLLRRRSRPIITLDDGELDTSDFARDLETTLGVKLSDEECERSLTVADLSEVLSSKISALTENTANGTRCLERDLWKILRRKIGEHYGVNPERVARSTRFVGTFWEVMRG